MTSSQTSRGSAGKNYNTYPLIPPAMQLGEQLHPCYFFWGGGGAYAPLPPPQTIKHPPNSSCTIQQSPVSLIPF